jgi:uncharacterized caspase-like protein
MRFLLVSGLVCLMASSHSPAGVIPGRALCAGQGKARVLSVGISQYADPKLNGRFAENDATAVADAFKKIGAESTVLIDQQATRASIRDALVNIGAQSESCDTVIFFFAGTGASRAGEFYLFPSDSPSQGDLRKTALAPDSLWDLLEASAADHVVILLDTDDASEFLRFALDRLSRKDQLNSRAVSIIAPQGRGRELQDVSHGLISYAILETLNPKFDVNGDGLISSAELEAGVAANVLTAQARSHLEEGSITRAGAVSRGADFAVGKVGPANSLNRGIEKPGQESAADATPAPKQLTGKYVAWLIATDHYDHFQNLNNPIRDADAVEDRLSETFGFEVHHLHDPKLDQLEELLEELASSHPEREDELFLYFAGHGSYVPEDEIGYIIASDSDKRERTMFSENRLMTRLKNTGWKHIFLVIDACQAGAILSPKRESEIKDPHLEHFLRPREKLNGLLARTKFDSYVVLTSGGDDFVDDGINHSPFAEKFLEALDTGPAQDDGILLPNDIRAKTIALDKPAPVFEFHLFNMDPKSEFWFIADPKLRGGSGPSHQ